MCGLAGVYGRGLTNSDVKIFRDLLIVSSLRGRDSTGVASVRKDSDGIKVDMLKEVMTPAGFIDYHWEYEKDFFCNPSVFMLMGHARGATVGSINLQNTHPFETDKLVAAHNGTLFDVKYVDKSKKRGKTDSEYLIKDISHKGLVPVLESLSPNSAYALSIFDKESRSLTLTRNKMRTLFFALNEKRPVIYWASEVDMLDLCLSRHDEQDYKKYYVVPFQPITFDEDFDHKSNAPWTTQDVKEPTTYHPFDYTIWYEERKVG